MLLESPLKHQKILTVDVKERSNFSWVSASLRAVCRLLIWSSFCRQLGIPQHHGQRQQLASEPSSVEIRAAPLDQARAFSKQSHFIQWMHALGGGKAFYVQDTYLHWDYDFFFFSFLIVIILNAFSHGLQRWKFWKSLAFRLKPSAVSDYY